MKKKVIASLGSVLFLSACSPIGQGAFLISQLNKGKSSDNTPRINVMAKPANPASNSYVAEVFQAVNDSSAYIPSENAIFEKSIQNGTNVNKISASDKREALDKLNSTGRQFVDKVKSTCTVNDPQISTSGEMKSGSTIVGKTSSSTTGKNCVLEMNTDVTASVYLNEMTGSGLENIERVTATLSAKVNYSRLLRDERIIAASNLKEIAISLNANAYGAVDAPKKVVNANANLEGDVKLVLANGEVISGPIKGLFNVSANGENSAKVEMAFLFQGSSPKGDIWLGVKFSDQKAEIYLNGQKISESSSTRQLTDVLESTAKSLEIQL